MTQEPIHVLLVEDNPDHAELMQRILKRQASVASVTAVVRGSECLELLSQNSYSVVLLDYSLPGMDGLSVLKEIRRRGYQVPVVMVTSQGVERVAVAAMQEGASDYVIKAAGYLTTLPTVLSKVLKQHELAMENARLYQEASVRARELEERNRQLRLLHDAVRSIAAEPHLERLLQQIVDTATELIGARYGALAVFNRDGRITQFLSSGLTPEEREKLGALPEGRGLLGLVFREGKPLRLDDLTSHPASSSFPPHHPVMRSLLAAPICRQEEILGALYLTEKSGGFAPEDEMLLTAFCADAALAVENARLYEGMEHRLLEARVLLELAQTFNSTLELKLLLKEVAERTAQAVGAERCSVNLFQDGYMVPVMSQFADGHSDPELWETFKQIGRHRVEEVPAHALAIERRAPVVIEDMASSDLAPAYWKDLFGIKSALVVPLIRRDEVVGILCLDHMRTVHWFTDGEVQLATTIASQVALAVDNARLYEETQRRLRESTGLLRVAQTLAGRLDLQEIARQTAREITRLLMADTSIFFEIDQAGEYFSAVVGYHVPQVLRDPNYRMSLADPPRYVVEARETGRPVASSDVPTDPRFDHPVIRSMPILPRSLLYIPLMSKGRSLGAILCYWWAESRQFTQEELQLAEGVASQVALAVDNARLFQEAQKQQAILQRRAERLAGLHAAASTVSGSFKLDEVLSKALDSAIQVMGMDGGAVRLLDEASGELVLTAVQGHLGEIPDWARRMKLGEGLSGTVALTKRPHFVPDISREPSAARLAKVYGSGSAASIPLMVRDCVVGTMSLVSRQPNDFDKEDMETLAAIGQQVGLAVENARLFEDTQGRLREARALLEMGQAFSSTLELKPLIKEIAQQVARACEMDRCSIYLWEGQRVVPVMSQFADGRADQVLWEAFKGMGRMTVEEVPFFAETVRRRGPVVINQPAEDPLVPKTMEVFQLKAVLVVPLIRQEKVVGAMALDNTERSHPVTPAQVAFTTAIASQVALALDNARLFAEVRRSYEDLRQAQEHLVRVERLRALGEMAGGVAHDFNNLLAVILGRAQYLQMGLAQLSQEAVERSLGIIEQSARDGAETVRHLFEFTRGASDIVLGPVNINEVVSECVAASEPRWKDEAEARGITVTVQTVLNATRPALGSAPQLREALLNLIFNAVEAMPDGGRLSLATWEDDNGVWLRIADEGIGMEEEVKGRVFEPFFTTKGPQRSGLGLSMVYGIIAHHGGTITIENGEGKGTAFLIRLPLAGTPETSPEPSPVPTVPPSTVLVIDDEQAVRETLADILEASGHTVVLAASGREGLEWVERQKFDLICTDLGMPGMSGWQVIDAVKALRPEAPIALITGWEIQVRPGELSAHPADFLLRKPFQISEVLATLAEARLRQNGAEH